MLVPISFICQEYNKNATLSKEIDRLAHFFKVSKLVIIRRLYDAGELTHDKFRSVYKKTLAVLKEKISSRGGGSFQLNFKRRMNDRFAYALIISTLEGKTLYRDCFRMLGIQKTTTFESIAKDLGIDL